MLFVIALTVLIISFSIGLPIYCRPFYYAHIDALDLPQQSGYSKEQIVEAYNEVLDYLTLPNKEFSAGVMKYSQSGAEHFADCKVLFNLNIGCFIVSAFVVACLLYLRKKGIIEQLKLGKYRAIKVVAVMVLGLPSIIGFFAYINFDKAFIVFHKIFFPGKLDWYFDPLTDEIISILPIEFFINCAILIGASLIIWSMILLFISTKLNSRQKKTQAD